MRKFSKITSVLFLVTLFTSELVSQNLNDRLVCKGEIPQFFLNSLDENFSIQKDIYDDFFSDKENMKDLKEEVILMSSLNHNFHFQNGVVLFGDEMTKYLNDIKDELLKDNVELREKINVFGLKSSEVNAFSTLEGHVYFSLGIVSRVKNESELAFIMAHEIAHFEQKHIIDGVADQVEFDKLKNKRNKLSLDDIYRLKFKRKKQQELEADSIGMVYMKNSIYNIDGGKGTMDILSKAELPIFDSKIENNLFNSDFLRIPRAYFKKELNPITEDLYVDDTYNTHPNIGTRNSKMDSYSEGITSQNGKKFFIKNTSEFQRLKLECIKYQLQASILSRNYVEVLYDIESFLLEYPNESSLLELRNKVLYAIARYKNRNSLRYTTPGYRSINGESQQLHYLLKTMTGRQVNTIAIRELFKSYKKNRAPYLDSLITSLAYDVFHKYDMSLDNYEDVTRAEKSFKDVYSKSWGDTLHPFKDQRSFFKNFYLLGLAKEKTDSDFLRMFKTAKDKYDKDIAWQNTPYKEKKKVWKANKKKNLPRTSATASILILSPEYFRYKKTFEKTAEATHTEKIEFESKLLTKLKEYNSKIDMLSISELKNGDVSKYNDFSLAMDWLNERYSHVWRAKTFPLLNDEIAESFLKEYDYISKITIINYKNGRRYFLINIYNLKTGELVMSSVENLYNKSSVDEVVFDVLEKIKRF